MSTHQIHVFISHAWEYSNNYQTLKGWIFDQPASSGQASFNLKNFSVPKDNPIHNATNDEQLRMAIYEQIRLSHVVVIPSGMYANYSKWINKEIQAAKHYSKPILGVNLWGAERKSSVVLSNADEVVGWNRQPVLDKIWQLYYK
jgi:hypothetical protein